MLFVTGPHAAGKTHMAGRLKEHGFSTVDLGPVIRAAHQEMAPNMSFGEFLRDGELREGPDFSDNLLVARIQNRVDRGEFSTCKDLAFIGSRSLRGIRFLQDRLTFCSEVAPKIIYIEAPEPVLYQRWCEREGRSVPITEFRTILAKDVSLGLNTIKPQADYLVVNTGSVVDFEQTVDELVFNKIGYSRMSN